MCKKRSIRKSVDVLVSITSFTRKDEKKNKERRVGPRVAWSSTNIFLRRFFSSFVTITDDEMTRSENDEMLIDRYLFCFSSMRRRKMSRMIVLNNLWVIGRKFSLSFVIDFLLSIFISDFRKKKSVLLLFWFRKPEKMTSIVRFMSMVKTAYMNLNPSTLTGKISIRSKSKNCFLLSRCDRCSRS